MKWYLIVVWLKKKNSLNAQNSSLRQIVFYPFYRWGGGGGGRRKEAYSKLLRLSGYQA